MAPDIFHPQFSLYKWRSPKIECLHWFKNKVISDVGQIVTSTHTSKKAEIVLWSSLNHCLWITECRVWSLLTGCSNWVKVIAAKKTGKNPDDPDVFPPFQGWDVDFFFFFSQFPQTSKWSPSLDQHAYFLRWQLATANGWPQGWYKITSLFIFLKNHSDSHRKLNCKDRFKL